MMLGFRSSGLIWYTAGLNQDFLLPILRLTGLTQRRESAAG